MPMTTFRQMAVRGKDILAACPVPIKRDKILSDYPLHWHVWHKDASSLEEELALNKVGWTGVHVCFSRSWHEFLTCVNSCGVCLFPYLLWFSSTIKKR